MKAWPTKDYLINVIEIEIENWNWPSFSAKDGPSVDHWPASLRSLTFLQSKSQALDVELRSCSLKDRRSFSLTEFLLDDIAKPPLAHNNDVHLMSQNEAGIISPTWNHSFPACILPFNKAVKVSLAPGSHTRLSTFFWKKNKLFPSSQKVKLTKPFRVRKVTIKLKTDFHTSQQMCACTCVCVCVKRLKRDGRRDVIPSSAAVKTKDAEMTLTDST